MPRKSTEFPHNKKQAAAQVAKLKKANAAKKKAILKAKPKVKNLPAKKGVKPKAKQMPLKKSSKSKYKLY